MNRAVILAAMIATLVSGCEEQQSSDRKMNAAQERMSAEAASQVGMPAIVNFQEKRMAKMILELRDKAISTNTYIVTLNGSLLKVCDSIGYGLPYATQYTSPQKDIYYGSSSTAHLAMPQADPNGLFSPATADGTWVLCLDPTSKQTKPVFLEPRVIVSPFPLQLTTVANH